MIRSDDTDATILDLLQENARISQADVARAVGLAPSAVLERIRKLEGRGVIKGYAALLDPQALGPVDARLRRRRTTQAPGDEASRRRWRSARGPRVAPRRRRRLLSAQSAGARRRARRPAAAPSLRAHSRRASRRARRSCSRPSRKRRACRLRTAGGRGSADDHRHAGERKLAWFAWIAVCLIWGTTYLGDPHHARDDAADADGRACAGRWPERCCSPATCVARRAAAAAVAPGAVHCCSAS